MSSWRPRDARRILAWSLAVVTLALASACAVETGPRELAIPTARPVAAQVLAPGATPAAVSAASVSDATTAPTKVIVYYPLDQGGDAQSGSCFANSLAVLSRDAWRCSVGNEILDPCFDLGDGKVVCGPNPLTGQSGVLVKLSESLPASNLITEKPSNPWLLELEDGSICSLATGATGMLEGKRINYLCSVPGSKSTEWAAVLGDPRPGVVWTVEKAVAVTRNGKLVSASSSTVSVRTVVKGPPRRVLFEQGATSASFQRAIQAGDTQDFVLWAFAGQTMIVDVTVPKGEVALSIVGRSTGEELAPGGNAKRWQVKLPETQDYRVRVAAPGGAAEYQLVITIPAPLQIAAGGQPTTVEGRVKPGQSVLYLLPGTAEQRVAVSVTSPEGRAVLAVYGLADRASLVPAVARTRSWEGVLPQEQDYVIEIESEGAASDYSLQVAAP